MYAIKDNLGWSDKDIAKFFGGRDRTTAYSNINACIGLLEIRDKKMLGIKRIIDEVWAGIFTED